MFFIFNRLKLVNELKDTSFGDNRFYLHGVVLKENLQSEEFKTGMVTGSKLGDIAKVLKEIVNAKESSKIVAVLNVFYFQPLKTMTLE